MMNLVIEKIKNIELYTKRLIQLNLLGHSRSLVKGSGLDFDQLRDYQIGDDVRALDWNSSARMNRLLVKQFNDERHRTVIVALDISASCLYGSRMAKHEILAQIAGIISYAGQLGKDDVGLILFTDAVELYIPPKKGKSHIQLILEKIFSAPQKNTQTNIGFVLEYIARLKKKNAMVFLVSDFIDDTFEDKLPLISRLYDLIAIRIIDEYEQKFPAVGLITVQDSESNVTRVIDARPSHGLQKLLQSRLEHQTKQFTKNRVDVLDISTNSVLIDRLIHFFKGRKR